jgi:hypothetical protein
MTAVYSGGGLYSGITSSTLPQVVNVAKANTPSITLGSSVNPSTVGQYVELTAVVFRWRGNARPARSSSSTTRHDQRVRRAHDDERPGHVHAGQSRPRTHSITTVYSGDSTYRRRHVEHAAADGERGEGEHAELHARDFAESVDGGPTVTFTAVLSGAAGTVTGNVVFRDNGLTISGCGGLALTAGHVTCAPRLSAGRMRSRGIYLGDANYNGITSSTVPQTAQ